MARGAPSAEAPPSELLENQPKPDELEGAILFDAPEVPRLEAVRFCVDPAGSVDRTLAAFGPEPTVAELGDADALFWEADSYQLFLTDGVFTEAVGFELSDNGRSAVFAEVDEEEVESSGVLVLHLAWRPDPA